MKDAQLFAFINDLVRGWILLIDLSYQYI